MCGATRQGRRWQMHSQLRRRCRAIRRSAALALVADGSLVLYLGQPMVVASAAVQWQVLTLPPPAPPAPSSFAEPGIVIAPDGTALADAATANTGAPPTVW